MPTEKYSNTVSEVRTHAHAQRVNDDMDLLSIIQILKARNTLKFKVFHQGHFYERLPLANTYIRKKKRKKNLHEKKDIFQISRIFIDSFFYKMFRFLIIRFLIISDFSFIILSSMSIPSIFPTSTNAIRALNTLFIETAKWEWD